MMNYAFVSLGNPQVVICIFFYIFAIVLVNRFLTPFLLIQLMITIVCDIYLVPKITYYHNPFLFYIVVVITIVSLILISVRIQSDSNRKNKPDNYN
jgi:hypothetical protein